MKLGYLAALYQHDDASIRKKHYLAVTYIAAKLFKKGEHVFLPLTHNLPIKSFGIYGNWEVRKEYDELFYPNSCIC